MYYRRIRDLRTDHDLRQIDVAEFWDAMKVYTEDMRMECVRYRYGH